MEQPDRKYRQGNQNRRILGRGKAESAVVTQTQKKQDENASLIKGTKPCGYTDKNYGVMYVIRVNNKPEPLGQPVYN